MKDESKITVTIELSGEDIGQRMSVDDVMPFVKGVFGSRITYETEQELFEYVMDNFISSANDEFIISEVLLEIDELITRKVAEFRKALHGGK